MLFTKPYISSGDYCCCITLRLAISCVQGSTSARSRVICGRAHTRVGVFYWFGIVPGLRRLLNWDFFLTSLSWPVDVVLAVG